MVLSLRNKFSVFAVIATVIVFLAQCQSPADKKLTSDLTVKDSTRCVSAKPLNPNGDSELALLMRSMYDSSASLMNLVKQGKLPDKFPDIFLKIHTATPTDSTVKTPAFDAFATDYVNGLNLFYHSSKEQLTSNYNTLLQKCVNCHQAFCPGPIKKINKLKLSEASIF
jgi:hypothetical protein